MTGSVSHSGADLATTVPADVAATIHRRRDATALQGGSTRAVTWDELGARLRLVAVALAAGAGRVRVGVAQELAGTVDGAVAELACLAAGAVLVLGGDTDVELTATRVHALQQEGAGIDAQEPDRFERAWAAVDPGDPALSVGDVVLTHANVRFTLRSLEQLLELTPDDRVASLVDDRGLPALLVRLLHARAGSSRSLGDDRRDLSRWQPTLVVAAAEHWRELAAASAAWARPRSRSRLLARLRPTAEGQASDGLAALRVGVCWGVAPEPETVAALAAAGRPLAQVHGVAVTGGAYAGAGPGRATARTVGRPLPGTSVRVGDEGQLLVRGGGVAAGRADENGWVTTGERGAIEDDGSIRLLPHAAVADG